MAESYIDSESAQQNVRRVAELFAAHGDFLLNVYRRELHDEDARDLWQELFMTLITRPVPESVTDARNYLYRAAINDIIDFKRHLKVDRRKIREYLGMARHKERQEKFVDRLIGREELLKAFKQIEKELPPAVGQALMHKHTKHMSHREIAEQMNIKKETVSSYLSVGTKMMEQLQDQMTGEDHV